MQDSIIVILKQDAGPRGIEEVRAAAKREGLDVKVFSAAGRARIVILGGSGELRDTLASLPSAERVLLTSRPYALVTREYRDRPTVADFGPGLAIGRGFTVIAGPCAVESMEMIDEIAAFISSLGIRFIRGGAFKARTSPYEFQGLGQKGLEYLRLAADRHGLKVVTEVLGVEEVRAVTDMADILQVGARNAQNFRLLALLGAAAKPVLLKRGFTSTIDELLQAAEYVMLNGGDVVILCERGIRTFETATRNTLDIAAVPVLKEISHQPVFVDPSHAAGRREWVPALACAALAAGADGIMVEIHPEPERALSDGPQSLDFRAFEILLARLRAIDGATASPTPRVS